MHISSRINPRTQSAEDVPVVLVTLGGKSKLLPRPSTHKEMQRLVRSHYDIDAQAGLQFEVNSWDICEGQNVEITEAAYPHLVALLDSVFVIVAQGQRDRVMPTPSATPPLLGDDELEDERTVQEDLAPNHEEEDQSDRTPKVKSDAEEEDALAESASEEDALASAQGDNDDAEENDAPQVQQAIKNEFPSHRQQAREAAAKKPARPAPAPAPARAKPRAVADRPDSSAESSRMAVAAASSDSDERFNVQVKGPGPNDKADFTTRRGHLVGKVLNGVCKNFKLDVKHAKLMLLLPDEDEDGKPLWHECELANDETIGFSGVKPHSRLIVRIEGAEEDGDEDEEYED
ncbi:hypothetical protein B0H16DRAFT_1513716 [Mycena metata]|uniref:Uncharacterized protein n=1 Tax=Mycena metata TaxID=1033252 RepID=A0AAD7JTJ6_9AGAR|nr:hypothetical protein B0H16DRAFT_1513716 [Mycena metata]